MQELDNVMELARLKEEAAVERLGIQEEGANKLAQIDIEITDITSQNSKQCAAIRAEYEEKVQELMNDAELEVVDLNNVRDRVSREVQARVAKEMVDIDAEALMYARDKELEKVIESAKNLAKAKQAVADAEKEAAAVTSARRSHEQQLERLQVFEALARNKELRIAGSAEVSAGANLSFVSDELDLVVDAGMEWLKEWLSAPEQLTIPSKPEQPKPATPRKKKRKPKSTPAEGSSNGP